MTTQPGSPTPSSPTTMAARLDCIRALWACFEARQWQAARRLFADDATMDWPASGERLLDADAIIRVNAMYPEGWRITVQELNALQDGRVHSVVRVDHPPACFIGHSVFRFEAALIVHVDETWATMEAPPAWRNAETLIAYERDESAPAPTESARASPLTGPEDTALLRDQLATLARYNLWATRKLCDQVDALNDSDYRRDLGLFFHSVHGTLNHLLVGEHLLWWRRFDEGVSPQVALNVEAEPDRARLRQRLLDGAAAWEPFIARCTPQRLAGRLEYTTTQCVSRSLPFAATLAHVFNHGTHHRGQISAGLTRLGRACPEIDLVWMLQTENPTT